MSKCKSRLDPFQAMVGEWKREQQRRRRSQRIHGGTHIVPETGQCELIGVQSTADGRFALDDEHGESGPREHDGRGKTIRTGTNDDRIVAAHGSHSEANEMPEQGPCSGAMYAEPMCPSTPLG